MGDDEKVLRNYYMMTVPQVSVFSGAVFGILMALRVKTTLAAGIFALIYGISLVILHVIVREHLGHLRVYKLFFVLSVILAVSGAAIIVVSAAHLY